MWKKHREFIDGQTGAHVQVLRNSETKAEHLTQIMVGHVSCPLCGTAHARPEEDPDPKAKVKEDIEMLNKVHENMMAYAAKHKVTVK